MSQFSVEDIPKTALPQEPTAFDAAPQAGDPALGIPLSSAAPDFMGETFGAHSWDAEEKAHEEALGAWYRAGVENLDKAVLDPDTAFKDADLSFTEDRDEARRLVINDSWLELNHDEPVAPDELQRRMQIQKVSLARFGEMVDSDEALFPLIQKDAVTRKETRELSTQLLKSASADSFLADNDPKRGFTAWKEGIKSQRGYDANKDADYYEAWHQVQSEVKDQVDAFRPELDSVWNAFTSKGDYAKAAGDAYFSLDSGERESFLAALKIRSESLPEDEQPAFWASLAKQSIRDVQGPANSLANAVISEGLAGGTVGWQDFLGSNEALAKRNASDREASRTFREKIDFQASVARIQQASYDPMKYLSKDGSWSRILEKGAYGAPGAIVTSAAAAIPFVGMASFYLSSQESIYQGYRQDFQDKGMSYEDAAKHAGELAPFAALPQVLMEKLQVQAIAGKLPIFEKALTSIMDGVKSRALRFGARATAGAVEQGTLENLQDYVPDVIQDLGNALGQDVPDVQWTGEGGVLDGFWTKNAEMMVTMLPLAIFGAAGGISRDARVKAFSNASDTELLAHGLQPDDLQAFREAVPQGIASANAALSAAAERADANSESAKGAVEELMQQSVDRKAAMERSQQSGWVPRIVQSADGYQVLDGESGEMIGQAADTAGAFRLASQHSSALSENRAEKMAYIASMLEAGENLQGLDPNSQNSFELGTLYTQAVAAAENPAHIDQFMQQVADEERLNGGTGNITRIALGQNKESLRGTVRSFTNRLFQGASVLTLTHETGHGMLRQLRASGEINRADELAFVRAVDNVVNTQVLRRGNQKGQSLSLLDKGIADADVTPKMLDEAIQKILEAEVLRSRKRNVGDKSIPLANGIISRNILALAKLAPGATQKFRAFLEAVRGVMGLASARALAMKKAIREGTLNEADYQAFLDKLTGRDYQAEHDAAVQAELGALNDFVPTENEPFSMGRTMVNPTAETRTFEGADESPTVIGPAVFSIGAYHGTPHNVDRFSNDKIGTGEGAQAFGYGLYFAASRKLAEVYRKTLSGGEYVPAESLRKFFTPGKLVPSYSGLDRVISFDWRGQGDWSVTVQAVDEKGNAKNGERPRSHFTLPDIKAVKEAGLPVAVAGNLYSVSLDVKEEDLLDYDKLMIAQSDKVKAALGIDETELASLAAELKSLEAKIDPATFDGSRLQSEIGAIERKLNRWNIGVRDYYEQLAKSNRGEAPGTRAIGGRASAMASKWLLDQGIQGVRYLDGASRDGGSGSYNYVIFDDSKIKITEVNGNPVDLQSESAFSLAPSSMVGNLELNATARNRNPEVRRAIFQRMLDNLSKLRRDRDELGIAFGKGYKRSMIEDPRKTASIRKEAAFREATRRAELEDEAHAKHNGILDNADLAKLKSQPVHEYLGNPDSPLRGRLMSQSAAIARGETFFDPKKQGDYDGADGISRSVFGGTLAPDQAAQELFDNGLIKEPTADAMWQALERESNSVAKMREYMKAARADVAGARKVAKAETKQWLKERMAKEAADYSPKNQLLRSLAMLDAIMMALPSELRGKIGGYTQLAKIGTDEKRLAFLNERLNKVDKVVESYLRVRFDDEMEALLKRSRPNKAEAGEKPRGKITADIHSLFAEMERAMAMTADDAEAEAMKFEGKAANLDGSLSADEEAHYTQLAQMIRLAGNWHHLDAASRSAAVAEATALFEKGYSEFKSKMRAKSTRRAGQRADLIVATGKSGSREEVREKKLKDLKLAGWVKKLGYSLQSFEQLVHGVFGQDSDLANYLADWERRASNTKEDAMEAIGRDIDGLLARLAGDSFKAEKLRKALADPLGITIQGWNGAGTFSQLEAITATLMWRQADGKRHMVGHLDDEGNPVGKWHYREQDLQAIEEQLSPEAQAIRLFIMDRYAGEWERLNPIFRDLYGINLPKNENYSPITVDPLNSPGGQMIDAETGAVAQGTSMTPGSLRTRSQSAIAQPRLDDALQVFLGHSRQMEHWMAYAPLATEAMSLLNNREVGDSVKASSGDEAINMLRNWIDLFAQGGIRDKSTNLFLNRMIRESASRLSSVALVGRASVLMIQSTQLAAASLEMPAGAYLARFTRLMMGDLGWRNAMASDYIQRRLAEQPPVVRQAMEGLNNREPSKLKFAMQKVGQTIAGADALFSAGTYAILYDYHLKLATTDLLLSGESAERYAHDAAARSTDRVAQPTRMGARSYYENSVTNPAAKLMWNFASDARQKVIYASLAAAKGKTAAQKFTPIALVWAMSGVLPTLLRSIWQDLRDDEDKEFIDARNWEAKRLALASLTGPFQGIPLLGDAITQGIWKAAGEFRNSGTLMDGIGNGFKAITHVDDIIQGERDFDEVMQDLEGVLALGAVGSGNSAAAASAAHIVRDLVKVAKNLVGE